MRYNSDEEPEDFGDEALKIRDEEYGLSGDDDGFNDDLNDRHEEIIDRLVVIEDVLNKIYIYLNDGK